MQSPVAPEVPRQVLPIVVANREPILGEGEQGGGGVQTGVTAGLLRFIRMWGHAAAGNESWVRWVAVAPVDDALYEASLAAGPSNRGKVGKGIQVSIVEMPKSLYHLYYELSANVLLWFTQHGLRPVRNHHSDAGIRDAWERGYRRANQAIADRVNWEIEHAPEGSIPVVMLQDYHLYLAARMIRLKHPEVIVQQFIHIPWPEVTEWRASMPDEAIAEMVMGILGNDVIGVQTEGDRKNLVATVAELVRSASTAGPGKIGPYLNELLQNVDVDEAAGTIAVSGPGGRRTVRVRDYPISVDVEEHIRRSFEWRVERHARHIRRWKEETRTEILIHLQGRIDRMKGFVIAVRGLQTFLRDHPEYVGRMRVRAQLQPSRPGIPEMDDYDRELDEVVTEVEEEFGLGTVIIEKRNDLESAAAYQRECDILLSASPADGMNLVVKEMPLYNLVKGLIVLSRRVGAFLQLGNSVVAIPALNITDRDVPTPEDVAQGLLEATQLLAGERTVPQRWLAELRQGIKAAQISKWFDDQMRDVAQVVFERLGVRLSLLDAPAAADRQGDTASWTAPTTPVSGAAVAGQPWTWPWQGWAEARMRLGIAPDHDNRHRQAGLRAMMSILEAAAGEACAAARDALKNGDEATGRAVVADLMEHWTEFAGAHFATVDAHGAASPSPKVISQFCHRLVRPWIDLSVDFDTHAGSVQQAGEFIRSVNELAAFAADRIEARDLLNEARGAGRDMIGGKRRPVHISSPELLSGLVDIGLKRTRASLHNLAALESWLQLQRSEGAPDLFIAALMDSEKSLTQTLRATTGDLEILAAMERQAATRPVFAKAWEMGWSSRASDALDSLRESTTELARLLVDRVVNEQVSETEWVPGDVSPQVRAIEPVLEVMTLSELQTFGSNLRAAIGRVQEGSAGAEAVVRRLEEAQALRLGFEQRRIEAFTNEVVSWLWVKTVRQGNVAAATLRGLQTVLERWRDQGWRPRESAGQMDRPRRTAEVAWRAAAELTELMRSQQPAQVLNAAKGAARLLGELYISARLSEERQWAPAASDPGLALRFLQGEKLGAALSPQVLAQAFVVVNRHTAEATSAGHLGIVQSWLDTYSHAREVNGVDAWSTLAQPQPPSRPPSPGPPVPPAAPPAADGPSLST